MPTKQRRKSSQARLLLVTDVHGLGRKGDVVTARPGYARNFLIPQGKAVIAEAHTLRIQERLQSERAQQAAIDREISQALAGQINGITLSTHVKVDPDGHLYGSVAVADIVALLDEAGFKVERHDVRLGQPLKQIGLHIVDLRLKEGVSCSFKLKVIPEGMDDLPEAPAPQEAVAQEQTEEQEAEEE